METVIKSLRRCSERRSGFGCSISIIEYTTEDRADSLDLHVDAYERFLARFSCVRHLELRSRHQARRPRERSNLNIATCFLRRSRKIWGERDGHFEGPCWLSGGAIVGELWLHRCGYYTSLRALTWRGSVFVTCDDTRLSSSFNHSLE